MIEPRSHGRYMTNYRWQMFFRVALGMLLAPLLYALSSGPMLAIAFWLREATGSDAFYGVMWLYVPLFMLPRALWDPYITWWVELFGTVGPG